MTAYEQGFITKCAEYGVDPEWLVKMAVGVKDIGKIYTLARKFSTRAYKRALDAALKGGRTYEHALFEAEQAAAKASSKFNGFTRVKSLNKGLENAANFSKNYGKKTVSRVGSTVSGSVPPKITAREVERVAANSRATINPVKNVRSRISSPSGRVPRKRIDPAAGHAVPPVRSVSGKSPAGPVSASGALGAASPVTNVTSVPPPESASTASTPVPGSVDASRPGFFSRWLNLLRGGNREQLAREYTDYSSGAKGFLKRLQTIADGTYDKTQRAELYKALDRSRMNTAAETARRLQSLNSEKGKVLATRLGTAAGVTGLGALGAGAATPPDYRSSNPRHSLDYWG